jgi:plastocyanin
VSKRLWILAACSALLVGACSTLPQAEVDFGEGARFVPFVMDSLDNVGQGASVAVGADGSAYSSYFGFPQELAEGEIAPQRPIGAPFLPAVLLSSMDTTGLVTHGAVQQTKPDVAPTGIGVPFGPDTPDALDLTPENVNGTTIAVGDDDTIHVAWAAATGVYYAMTSPGGSAMVDEVFPYGFALRQAGPIGKPAITLDGNGNPWIAFGVNGTGGVEIKVATKSAGGWDVQDAAIAGRCNGCPQPLPTGIAVVKDAPVVVFGDPGSGTVKAAALQGVAWTESSVESNALGAGLSFSSAGDAAYAAYYTNSGAVHVAAWDGSSWSTSEIGTAPEPTTTSGLDAASTAVTVDDQGSVYVAYQDDAGVQLLSGDGSSFDSVGTDGTAGGTGPALAAGDGHVFLAWYDPGDQNLMLGIQGDLTDVLLANPSPAPTVSLAPAGNAECGADGKIQLDIVAKGIAFDTNCLVAPANEPFEINFDNQDAGVPHNVSGYVEAGGATLWQEAPFPGVDQVVYKVDALDPGTYFFQCDVHPTTMTGTLAVVETKGGK